MPPSLVTCSCAHVPQLGVSPRGVELPFSPRSLAAPTCLLSSNQKMEFPKTTKLLPAPFYDWMPNPAPHWAFTNLVAEKKCLARAPQPETTPAPVPQPEATLFDDAFESDNILCRNFAFRNEALRKAGGQKMRAVEKTCAESCRNFIREKNEEAKRKTKQRELAHQRTLLQIAETRKSDRNVSATVGDVSPPGSSYGDVCESARADPRSTTYNIAGPHFPGLEAYLPLKPDPASGSLTPVLTRNAGLLKLSLKRSKSERMKSVVTARRTFVKKSRELKKQKDLLGMFEQLPRETQELFQKLWLTYAVSHDARRASLGSTDVRPTRTLEDISRYTPEEKEDEDWRITPKMISGSLLQSIVASAGLKPHNTDEKMMMQQLIDKLAKPGSLAEGEKESDDHHAGPVPLKDRFFECTLVQLAVDIVSKVRKAFVEGATSSHHTAFLRRAEESGLLEVAQAKALVYELAAPFKANKPIGGLANEKKLHEMFSSKYSEMPKFPNGSLGINFALFQPMVQEYREISTAAKYVAEDSVAIRYCVPYDLTNGILRGHLTTIHAVFEKNATGADEDDMLPSELLPECLEELGIMPKNIARKTDMLDSLSIRFPFYRANKRLTFRDFLEACAAAREFNVKTSEDVVRAKFKALHDDGSDTLDLKELSAVLKQMGMAPQTAEGQEALATMLVTIEEDADARTLNISEFTNLYSWIKEGLQSLQYKHETEMATCFGFSREELSRFRTAFAELDQDGRLGLKLFEVRSVMDRLNVKISAEALRDQFKLLDANNSGVLEFPEFLQLMNFLKTTDAKSFATASLRRNSQVKIPSDLQFLTMSEIGQREKESPPEAARRGSVNDLFRDLASSPSQVED